MANVLLNIMSAVSESDQLSACLRLCDVLEIADASLINDVTLDKMENYVRQKCVKMNIEERKIYLDDDILHTPFNFMFSPAVRQRILNVCAAINNAYKISSVGATSNDHNLYDLIRKFICIMGENQKVRLMSLTENEQLINVDNETKDDIQIIVKQECIEANDNASDIWTRKEGNLDINLQNKGSNMSILESMAHEFLPLINSVAFHENSILNENEVIIKLEKFNSENYANIFKQKIKHEKLSNHMQEKVVQKMKSPEKKLSKETPKNNNFNREPPVVISLLDTSDEDDENVPLPNILKRKESLKMKEPEPKRLRKKSDISISNKNPSKHSSKYKDSITNSSKKTCDFEKSKFLSVEKNVQNKSAKFPCNNNLKNKEVLVTDQISSISSMVSFATSNSINCSKETKGSQKKVSPNPEKNMKKKECKNKYSNIPSKDSSILGQFEKPQNSKISLPVSKKVSKDAIPVTFESQKPKLSKKKSFSKMSDSVANVSCKSYTLLDSIINNIPGEDLPILSQSEKPQNSKECLIASKVSKDILPTSFESQKPKSSKKKSLSKMSDSVVNVSYKSCTLLDSTIDSVLSSFLPKYEPLFLLNQRHIETSKKKSITKNSVSLSSKDVKYSTLLDSTIESVVSSQVTELPQKTDGFKNKSFVGVDVPKEFGTSSDLLDATIDSVLTKDHSEDIPLKCVKQEKRKTSKKKSCKIKSSEINFSKLPEFLKESASRVPLISEETKPKEECKNNHFDVDTSKTDIMSPKTEKEVKENGPDYCYEKITECCQIHFGDVVFSPHKDYTIIFPPKTKETRRPFAHLFCYICRNEKKSKTLIKFNLAHNGNPIIWNIVSHLKTHFAVKK